MARQYVHNTTTQGSGAHSMQIVCRRNCSVRCDVYGGRWRNHSFDDATSMYVSEGDANDQLEMNLRGRGCVVCKHTEKEVSNPRNAVSCF